MAVYGYLRASTKEQDALRAEEVLKEFAKSHNLTLSAPLFVENDSGSKLHRVELFKMLDAAQCGDIILIEAVDRLSRLNDSDWKDLLLIIDEKRIKIVSIDLPTSWMFVNTEADEFTNRVFEAINRLMLEILSAMARKDYEMRKERCKQGVERAKAKGIVLGRKRDDSIDRESVFADLASGLSYRSVAAKHSISLGTVQRIKQDFVRVM